MHWQISSAANGNKVVKTNIVNDRGIHICKSMLAWLKYGNGETPETSGKKGDHLIGDYYVAFDKHYKAEVKELMAKFQGEGLSEEEAKAKAESESPLMKEAREMLVKWEANDPEVRALWKKMNDWVYVGFDETYRMMGVTFDKIYYESETYLEGKERRLWKAWRKVSSTAKKTVPYGPTSQGKDWIISCFFGRMELLSI